MERRFLFRFDDRVWGFLVLEFSLTWEDLALFRLIQTFFWTFYQQFLFNCFFGYFSFKERAFKSLMHTIQIHNRRILPYFLWIMAFLSLLLQLLSCHKRSIRSDMSFFSESLVHKMSSLVVMNRRRKKALFHLVYIASLISWIKLINIKILVIRLTPIRPWAWRLMSLDQLLLRQLISILLLPRPLT